MQTEWKQPRKIYLAGKIGKDDWRGEFVDRESLEVEADWQTQVWPILPKVILNRFDYVGPYFMYECGQHIDSFRDSGGHCDSTHANTLVLSAPSHMRGYARTIGAASCLNALRRADAVFAWMPTTDAYGTIAEIGAAVALGIPVVIAAPSFSDDQWFVRHLPDVYSWEFERPTTAFYFAAHHLGWMFDSPVEHEFWQSWVGSGAEHDILDGLVCQYSPEDLPIHIDFAHPKSRTAIEIDGYTFHNSESAFARDRQRDRMLAAMGWAVIRFTGREAMANIGQCVQEALHVVRARMPFAGIPIGITTVPLLPSPEAAEQTDLDDDDIPY